MPPDRCLFWVAAALCAVLTAASAIAASAAPGGCFVFNGYDSGNATVELHNTCSRCRNALLRFCDGYTLRVNVPAGSARRVKAFAYCVIKVAASRTCGEPQPESNPRISGRTDADPQESNLEEPHPSTGKNRRRSRMSGTERTASVKP